MLAHLRRCLVLSTVRVLDRAATGSSAAKMGYLTRDLFQFLRDLKRNNNRDWFQRNKDRYETSVRDPILKFIVDVGPRIKKLSPHFIADASPSGGSMMRV